MTEKSFQERYYLHEGGWWRRLWRDIRFLGYIASVIWYYAILGHKVRRDYRACEARGETYWIDPLDSEEI